MKKTPAIVWGCILLVIGILALLIQLDVLPFSWSDLGRYFIPLVFLGLTLLFHGLYFSGGRTSPGLLVPGGIFLIYSILWFLWAGVGNWVMGDLYPLWILGPAVGLAAMNLAAKNHGAAWTAPLVLTIVSLVLLGFSFFHLSFGLIVAIALIAVGIALLVGTLLVRNDHSQDQ